MTCENREHPDTGLPCTAEAEWVIHVGSRAMDAQQSCTDCLGVVCRAMHEAEGRPEVVLRVKKLLT